jgi:SAM-dependent methyltransferase
MSLEDYSEYLQGRRWTGDAYRRRYLYPRLCQHLSGRVLDIGSGIGDMLAFRPDTIGLDINPHLVEFCRQRGLEAMVMNDDGSFPFNDNDFDSILLDNVIEHIVNPVGLLHEARRVLKSNGTLLIGVPGARGFASDPDHKIFYTRAELIATIEPHGFVNRAAFAMPLGQSKVLSKQLRMYCEYVRFERR